MLHFGGRETEALRVSQPFWGATPISAPKSSCSGLRALEVPQSRAGFSLGNHPALSTEQLWVAQHPQGGGDGGIKDPWGDMGAGSPQGEGAQGTRDPMAAPGRAEGWERGAARPELPSLTLGHAAGSGPRCRRDQ